jgi:hypothetical protein
MRCVLALACLLACGKSDTPAPAPAAAPAVQVPAPVAAVADPAASASCAQARDKYLAWTAERVKSAIGTEAGTMRAELQAEADKEAAQAKERFVAACLEIGSELDASCFEKSFERDRARKKHCDQVVHALEAKMFARR